MAELPGLTAHHRALRRRARLVPGAAALWWRGPANLTPSLALTFDDGPDPIGTNAVLRVLDRHRARATFFVLLSRARKAPRLCQDLVACGHEIGLHADVHERLHGYPLVQLTQKLAAWRAELEDLIGTSVQHHRPPYGSLSWKGLVAARRAGLDVVMWSHDPCDWRDAGSASFLPAALGASLVPRAIVLLHDGAEWPGGNQGQTTAEALGQVLAQAGSLRPALVTVTQLITGADSARARSV